MSQTTRTILAVFITTIIAGGGVYLWQTSGSPKSPSVSPREQKTNETEPINKVTSSGEWENLIKYNCELSGGSFNDGSCECPIEKNSGQTQDMMYDKNTGYCQTTSGGPGGDAFAASVGFPWGNYSFWTEIVGNNCTESGGSWLNARCICPDGKNYNQSTGSCE
jgi:hypothetical protein